MTHLRLNTWTLHHLPNLLVKGINPGKVADLCAYLPVTRGATLLTAITHTRASYGCSKFGPCGCRPDPLASLGVGSSAASGARGPSKGMQLGKAKKGAADFLDSLRAEGDVIQVTALCRQCIPALCQVWDAAEQHCPF